MSGKPIALAGNRLLLSLRNLSCFTASDRIDLLARQPLIRKNCSSARDASMSGAHPPMTAIVVTKKNLPSFSEKRAAVQSAQSPPHAYDDDTLRTQASRRESGAVPSSTAVESALRSALGIGHSETTGTTPVPTAVPQPSPEFSANVSTQDPAILDWSLCDPGSEERAAETEPKPMKTSSTRILRLLHVDGNEGFRTSEADRAEESSPADAVTRTTTEADAGSKPVAVAESNSSEPSLTAAGVRRPF
uniref:Uncharacterized protein n=1 Tax=Hyalomma excavatum TaxID=257692 RepID=A0A131XL47_9ACAR